MILLNPVIRIWNILLELKHVQHKLILYTVIKTGFWLEISCYNSNLSDFKRIIGVQNQLPISFAEVSICNNISKVKNSTLKNTRISYYIFNLDQKVLRKYSFHPIAINFFLKCFIFLYYLTYFQTQYVNIVLWSFIWIYWGSKTYWQVEKQVKVYIIYIVSFCSIVTYSSIISFVYQKALIRTFHISFLITQ